MGKYNPVRTTTTIIKTTFGIIFNTVIRLTCIFQLEINIILLTCMTRYVILPGIRRNSRVAIYDVNKFKDKQDPVAYCQRCLEMANYLSKLTNTDLFKKCK